MGLFLVEMTWFVLNIGERTGPPILGMAPVMIGAAVAMYAFWCTWHTPGLPWPVQRFWRSMTVASAPVVLMQLTDLPGYLKSPSVTPNPVSLGLYGASMIVIVVALYRLPMESRGPGGRLRLMLDCATVTLAALLVIWYAALSKLAESDDTELLVTTAVASVALALVVLAFAKVVLSGGRTIEPYALRAFGVGLGAQMLGTFATPLMLETPWVTPEPLGRSLMYLIVVAGAAYQIRAAGLPVARRRRSKERAFSPVPYLAIALVDGFLLYAIRDSGGATLVIGGGAVALTGLVIARQLAAFRENSRLITEVRSYHDQLAYQANHDSLTGLANRALFNTEFENAVGADRLHLALVDLDDFKAVNDTSGHHVGDGLLIAVAERLRASVRPGDLVARLGGDEFAVLLHDLAPAGADAVAARMLATLQQPLSVDGHQLTVRASVGVVDASEATDPAELMRHADAAMYQAKHAGKGRFARYDAGEVPAMTVRARLIEDLGQAVDRDQLVLRYQPIVGLPGETLLGVEALLRWEHPERGTVPPLDFLPAAEETGLIVPIGRWVLTTACAQAATWLRDFPAHAPQAVNVNVSPLQLRDDGLVGDVAAALHAAGLAPHHLVIEVTETAAVDDRAAATLAALRDLGVRISLDDFGTGHSALSVLGACPVDQLKLDRSFADPAREPVAVALARIAEALGVEAVAEGIESPAQAARLAALGYRLGQGYHFDRPLTPDEVGTRLAGHAVPAYG
ncbi:putative bifunctional diguanylate cyclase/phosphodiesterase [Paractinoplanes rishiriensis]|uniref:Diguanylate cyclase/phosphodiesterase n=1 Tax=Paractinoplanes rishiriensis TaxID=1050105 RepID=A0A919MZ27_9ACTN|nr:EAL domain-containing protein [Actinoplanes rishiriensis]GIF00959.1 hypothetical protein Ari01nite_84230 [Actinoplanes rishiriensis]